MIPPRSVLYVPASRPKMLRKIRDCGADAVIVDLEDAVAPSEKVAARANVSEAHRARILEGGPCWMLRIAAPGSVGHEEDLSLAEWCRPPRVVIPKAEEPRRISRLAERFRLHGSATALGIETARGVEEVSSLAGCHGSVQMLLLGSADLRLSLGARPDPDRIWERHVLGALLVAARAHGLVAIDGVFFRYRDVEGLLRHARVARDLGYDGKSCIHPEQIAAIHGVWASSAEEVSWARRVLEAWSSQDGERAGVITMDGEMVERLHLRVAERILARGQGG